MEGSEQDLRQRLSSSLDGLTDEFLVELRDQLFTMERITAADCPHCGQSAKVRVPDYRGITAALATLADQGKGKAATAIPQAPKEISRDEALELIRGEMKELGMVDLARGAR